MKTTTTPNNLQSEIYSLIVPQDILENFEVTGVIKREADITLELTEKPEKIPKELLGKDVVMNGYLNQLELQSFPLQGKPTYLRLIRRRWKEQGSVNNTSYHNEYDFAASGTKSTKDFGLFLKEYL